MHLVQAEQIVTKAEQRNADDEAIYEYTMAMRYLEKAREENGYADYKDSTELSKTSSEWADKAVEVVEMGGPQYRPKPPPAEPEGDESLPDGSDEPLEGDLLAPDGDGDLPESDDLLEDE